MTIGLVKTGAAVLAVVGLVCATSGMPGTVLLGVALLVMLAVACARYPEILED